MNSKTLSFLVLWKYFELAFQITLFTLIVIGTQQLAIELQGELVHLLILSSICCVLAGYNFMVNNLFTNFRFLMKTKCNGVSCLIYEGPNLLCCFIPACKHSKHVLMDHPKYPKICCAKWIIKFILFTATAILIGF